MGKSGRIVVLFTCIGRRVSLLKSFRSAAGQLKIKAKFLGTDVTELSSAMQLCDKHFIVSPIKGARYLSELLEIVKTNKVNLLVPTIDWDLKLLAKHRSKFKAIGCRVLVSAPEVVDICQDKRKTYRFMSKNNFGTASTVSLKSSLVEKHPVWPRFLKPWNGSASKGNVKVSNRKELLFHGKRIPNCIVQEFIDGTEFTCDVYVDFEMKVRCVVPRKRIEVRGGEVSKGKIEKNLFIMTEAAKLVEKLGAGPGVITLQLFAQQDGKIKFIEVNPRFGGGVPLSIKAGANFPKWLLQELTGRKTHIKFDGFKDGLVMLRYDGEVWIKGS